MQGLTWRFSSVTQLFEQTTHVKHPQGDRPEHFDYISELGGHKGCGARLVQSYLSVCTPTHTGQDAPAPEAACAAPLPQPELSGAFPRPKLFKLRTPRWTFNAEVLHTQTTVRSSFPLTARVWLTLAGKPQGPGTLGLDARSRVIWNGKS